MKKLSFIIILATITYLFITKTQIYASNFSVGIFPPETKINQQTESKATVPIYIQNYDNNDSINLNFQIRPFVPSNKFDGQPEIVPETTTLNPDYAQLLSNIKILDGDTQIKSFTLSPTQRKQIILEINLSSSLPAGDYYLSFIAKSTPSSLDDTNLSSIVAGVASNIILTVGQPERPSGIIQDFSTPLFTTNGPIPISLLLENTSKNVFSPTGNIIIKNMYGQTVGALNLLPVSILSHSSRFIPDNNSSSKTQIIWNEKNPLGVYKTTLTLALSPQGPIFQRTIYFLALPIKLIIVFGIAFFIIISIMSRVITKLKENNE